MKIYFAGYTKQFYPMLKKGGVKNILVSFFNYNRLELEDKLKEFNLMVDSGGYSVRVHNIIGGIDIKKYGEFLLRNKEFIQHYVNLDTNNLKETLDNQKYLESLGLKPIPVFHYSDLLNGHEDIYLYYLKNYEYIGIGGTAGVVRNNSPLERYYNFIFRHNSKYKRKLHAFGCCNPTILKKYPFYSIDTTAWFHGGKYKTLLYWDKLKTKRIPRVSLPEYLRQGYKIFSFKDIKGYEINKDNIKRIS